MSISISPTLKLIIEEIKNDCTKDVLIDRFDLKQLLSTTNGIERHIIAKVFCGLPWNVGSLRVLAILHELRISTGTEYILSLEDNEQVQLILNDFLEAEYELLADLFVSANYDLSHNIKLNTILDECLLSLFKDLLQNPSLNDLSYLLAMKELLPAEILVKVTFKHIDTMLELHKSSIQSAFTNFSEWIDEGVDRLHFIKMLQKNLICGMEEEVLKYLFKISAQEQFREWKFYLMLLQAIASHCKAETNAFIRKYLRARVREIAAIPNKKLVLHMLLTARAGTATTVDKEKNINAYADWYRQNIAEMKFVLNVEEFQNFCALLEQCIAYEMEEYYLDIHATISISPPVLCGKIVQTYKTKCKLRLSQIKNGYPEFRTANCTALNDSD